MTCSGKSESKGKGKSKRSVDSMEFEEETWEETDETEQEQWWNSWTKDDKPKRDEAPLGALMVRCGIGFELNQNCIWRDLAR